MKRNPTSRIQSALSKKLFRIRVPLMATYSEEEMDIFGMPQDEFDGKVRDASEAMTMIMINLDKMIDMYSQGYRIQVANPNDTKLIFTSLEKYLRGTLDTEEFSLNTATITDDRMEEIDKFAQEMFGLNRVTIVKGTIDANNSFGVSLNLMNQGFGTQNQEPIEQGTPTGILAAYSAPKNTQFEQPVISRDRSYASTYNNSPEINFSEVTRKSTGQRRRGATMQDMIKQG